MTWVKLDDGFIRHPKTRQLSHRAVVLHLAGLCYCAAQLTDGRIERSAIPMLLAEARVNRLALAELLAAKIWVDHGDCYSIHDYLQYQESRRTVLERREKWANKKRGQRGESHEESPRDSTGESEGESHAPVPSRPVPSSNSTYETSSRHPHGVDTTDERIKAIADAVVTWRINGKPVSNHPAYRAVAVPAVIAEHGPRIRELIALFPFAPIDSIVHAIETGETRGLAMFADDEPPPATNVVDMPARKLNGEERLAALQAAGAPVRLTGKQTEAPL